jgi:hypothetical protein
MLAVTWITEVILELIHAKNLDSRRDAFIRSKPNGFGCLILMTLNNFGLIVLPCADNVSFEGVPYQLSTVI